MRFTRQSPGPCPICGIAHTGCGAGPITIQQLPARDAAAIVTQPPVIAEASPATATLPSEPFTTSSYRRLKKQSTRKASA